MKSFLGRSKFDEGLHEEINAGTDTLYCIYIKFDQIFLLHIHNNNFLPYITGTDSSLRSDAGSGRWDPISLVHFSRTENMSIFILLQFNFVCVELCDITKLTQSFKTSKPLHNNTQNNNNNNNKHHIILYYYFYYCQKN